MTGIVVCRRQPWRSVDDLIDAGRPNDIELRWLERAADPESARAALSAADVLMGSWLDGWPFRSEDFASAERLRFIQLLSAGFDGLDLAPVTERGLPISSIGAANASTVAEHAITLMLALLRQLPAQQELVRSGGWRPAPAAREARSKSLGIVGLGRIGIEVARRARAFDMDVLYHSRHRVSDEQESALSASYRDSLPALLAESDVLVLCASLNDTTRNLIGATELAVMKPGAILINIARGGLVDESALADALERGALAGAGLDVLAIEPPRPDNPLLRRPDVIVTPHQAGISPDAWPRIVAQSWDNVRRVLDGDVPLHRVA